MKFPATSDELKRAGYEYLNDAICRGKDCGEQIEFWLTPNDRQIPLSIQKAGNVLFQSGEVRVPHHSVCPNVEQFRKPK